MMLFDFHAPAHYSRYFGPEYMRWQALDALGYCHSILHSLILPGMVWWEIWANCCHPVPRCLQRVCVCQLLLKASDTSELTRPCKLWHKPITVWLMKTWVTIEISQNPGAQGDSTGGFPLPARPTLPLTAGHAHRPRNGFCMLLLISGNRFCFSTSVDFWCQLMRVFGCRLRRVFCGEFAQCARL